jgi:glycosyltransferase involved in cell wall biosynthesis
MTERKIRVAMVCHFSNERVREKLNLGGLKTTNFVRRVLGKEPLTLFDFAPWVNNIIYQSQSNDEIELHIISPHQGMSDKTEFFQDAGISYYFFKSVPSYLMRKVDDIFFKGKLYTTYNSNRKAVSNFLNTINPDIVVLVGAENPYYGNTILELKKKPLYVLCQTIFNNPEFEPFAGEVDYNKRALLERKIFGATKYVGVSNDKQKALLKKLGYQGYIFDFHWPPGAPFKPQPCEEKQYDFINFANGMSSDKGYHDCIKALSFVKKHNPNVKLALVDKGPENVRKELIELINEYGLKENVFFIPFFEKKTELLQFLHNVRFAVLPCKLDHISGTMHQAMGQGLPTIVYETTGTPSLNEKKQCVLIAPMNDYEQLGRLMVRLMSDSTLASELKQNSLEFMAEYRRGNEKRMNQLIEEFKAIIANYYDEKPIPSHLLYKD